MYIIPSSLASAGVNEALTGLESETMKSAAARAPRNEK